METASVLYHVSLTLESNLIHDNIEELAGELGVTLEENHENKVIIVKLGDQEIPLKTLKFDIRSTEISNDEDDDE